jgi:transposase
VGYPSDLTDEQWELVRDLFETRRGAPPRISRRRMVDAISYVARTGCGWRYLPGEFGAWGSVWQQFRRWRDRGVWSVLLRRLAEGLRVAKGRAARASMLMVDGQTSKGARRGRAARRSPGPERPRCARRPRRT